MGDWGYEVRYLGVRGVVKAGRMVESEAREACNPATLDVRNAYAYCTEYY